MSLSVSEENISCLTATVLMIFSIPGLYEMFKHQTYRTGASDQDTAICDELSRYLNGESKSVSDSAKVQFLESIFFRVFHECISQEMQSSNESSKKLWDKFTEGASNFLEQEIKRGSTITQILEDKIRNDSKIPGYLMVRVHQSKTSYIRPDKQIILSNGDFYQLRCIVDRDQTTGRYSCYRLGLQRTWTTMADERDQQPASEREVMTTRNYLYLYERRYPCKVDGCPSEDSFPDQETLDHHLKTEHPTCSDCNKKFLLGVLYREHRANYCGKRTKKRERNFSSSDSGNGSMMEEESQEILSKINILEKRRLLDGNSSQSPKMEARFSGIKKEVTDQRFPRKSKVPSIDQVKSECLASKIRKVGEGNWTNGCIFRDQSGRDEHIFCSFNSSYIKSHQTTFYRKTEQDYLTILSYCPDSSKKIGYEFVLHWEGCSPVTIRGEIGDKKRVPFPRNSLVIRYDLNVWCKD